MKTLELNQMEGLKAGELPENCNNYNGCMGMSMILLGPVLGLINGLASCQC